MSCRFRSSPDEDLEKFKQFRYLSKTERKTRVRTENSQVPKMARGMLLRVIDKILASRKLSDLP